MILLVQYKENELFSSIVVVDDIKNEFRSKKVHSTLEDLTREIKATLNEEPQVTAIYIVAPAFFAQELAENLKDTDKKIIKVNK